MNSYNAIIVDDEPKIRKVLQIKIEQYCSDIKIVDTAGDINEGFQKIVDLNPSLIFLDISMPGGTGFELLDKFDTINFEVIFVTGFNDYVLDALKVSAVDYLLKPVVTEDLIAAVNKAKERITNREKIEKYAVLKHNLNNIGNQDTKLAIPGANSYDFIKIADIIRCEGWQKYTRIYLTDGTTLVSSYNIGIFKNMLENYAFFSTHKSHLINTKMITKYLKEGTVVMSDGANVPVSRRKKDEFVSQVLNGFLLN